MVQWMMDDVKHKIDPKQFGCLKGTPTSFCLIDMINNWLKTLDAQSHYLRICFIDFSKGVVKTRNGGISRNMAEYHGIWRNITEYGEISRNITTFSRNIPEHHKIYKSKPAERRDRTQSNGSHAPVYKHGRLTMDGCERVDKL